MDPAAIQKGAGPLPAPETAIQSGAPPLAPNSKGSVPQSATESKLQRQEKPLLIQGLEYLASLRLTVVLFALSMLLVLWGTLAQQDAGVWTVVNKYFRAWFVLVPMKVVLLNTIDNTRDVIPFPGGLLLGAVMLVNLLAAHIIRFKVTWARSGIILIHAGIIIMMLGEVVTYLYAVERNMMIPVGQSSNRLVDARHAELAIIRTLGPDKDEVVVIPASMLKPGAKIHDDRLPFDVEVLEYMVNSKLVDFHANAATKGVGATRDLVESVPEVSGVDPNQQHDVPSAYVRLSHKGQDLGVWLVSSWISDYLNEVQEVKAPDGKTYQVGLRYKQTELPFFMHLTKFTHEVYPGTNVPKDYHAFIHLMDPTDGVDRNIEIYMNAPLRYRGETFYQSGVNTDMQGNVTTILQVVRNPGWLMPYFSCAIVGVGMLIHFGVTLNRFLNRRTVR
jgi:hypothetical protein